MDRSGEMLNVVVDGADGKRRGGAAPPSAPPAQGGANAAGETELVIEMAEADDGKPLRASSTVPEKLRCPSCFNLIKSPILYKKCSHSVCITCFARSCSDRSCLLCKVPFGKGTVSPDYALQTEVNNVLVFCSNYEMGCSQPITVAQRAAHQATCKFSRIECPNRRFGCDATLTPQELSPHVSSECRYIPALCPYSALGCSHEASEPVMREHAENCVYGKVQVLQQENAQLRNAVKIVAQEMQYVKAREKGTRRGKGCRNMLSFFHYFVTAAIIGFVLYLYFTNNGSKLFSS